jgi:hypothetical protein
VRWVIVDDGVVPTHPEGHTGFEICYIRREPQNKNTQAENLWFGLNEATQEDNIVFIEDDDYYSPKWLETVAKHLEFYDLFGERDTIYYNIKTRSYRHNRHSRGHASLCATSMRGHLIPKVQEICKNNEKYLDHRIWELRGIEKYTDATNNVIGIKGLPGRPGICFGHDSRKLPMGDKSGQFLEGLIGADAKVYDSIAY